MLAVSELTRPERPSLSQTWVRSETILPAPQIVCLSLPRLPTGRGSAASAAPDKRNRSQRNIFHTRSECRFDSGLLERTGLRHAGKRHPFMLSAVKQANSNGMDVRMDSRSLGIAAHVRNICKFKKKEAFIFRTKSGKLKLKHDNSPTLLNSKTKWQQIN